MIMEHLFLAEVSNQMLELYEQNKAPLSQASEAEGSAGGTPRPPPKASGGSEENIVNHSHSQGIAASKVGSSKSAPRLMADEAHSDNHVGAARAAQSRSNDHGNSEAHNPAERKGDGEVSDNQQHEQEPYHTGEAPNVFRYGSDGHNDEYQERSEGRTEIRDAGEFKDKSHGRIPEYKDGAVGQSPQPGPKLDKNKLKAQIEKRRKSRPDVSRKTDVMDDDDLIERELEDGIELAAENEKSKSEREQSWSKTSNRLEHDNSHHFKHHDEAGDGHYSSMKGQSSHGEDFDNVEEGELEPFDNADRGYQSPKLSNRKRKAGSPADKLVEGKQRHDYHNHSHHDFPEDRNRLGRLGGYSEREHKRHVQENHV